VIISPLKSSQILLIAHGTAVKSFIKIRQLVELSC